MEAVGEGIGGSVGVKSALRTRRQTSLGMPTVSRDALYPLAGWICGMADGEGQEREATRTSIKIDKSKDETIGI